MPENLINAVQRLQAELGKAHVELTHRVGWQERCERAEAERDRALAVVEAAREITPVSERALLPVYLKPLCDALAAFDAAQDGKGKP